jgi:hypothetical protein
MVRQNIIAAGIGGRDYSLHGRQKAEREEGTGDQVYPSKTNHHDLFPPGRPHFLKFPSPLKIVPLAGNQEFNT